MKKSVLFFVAALTATFGTQSCLDNELEVDPMAGGIEIYRVTRSQHNVAMDGANIAFRLNVLLSEVARILENDPGTEINLTEIWNEAMTVNVSSKLFKPGYTTITLVDDDTYPVGTYRIVYTDVTNYSDVDYRRKGGILIYTNGKLLTDPDFTQWSIVSDPDNPMKSYLGYDYVTGEEVFGNIDFGANYAIFRGRTNNEWTIEILDFQSSMGDLNSGNSIISSWNSFMYVKTTDFDTWEYDAMTATNTRIELHGQADGTTMYTTDNGAQYTANYEIPADAPMVFTLDKSCAWNFYNAATELADINATNIDRSVFPSLSIELITTAKGTCSVAQTLKFNGMTKTY